MPNSTGWVSPDTHDNIDLVHTILDMAFKAAGIAGLTIGAYNYAAIVHAITRVARGQAGQDDLRLAEEGLRQGGPAVERVVQAVATGLVRMHHDPEAQNLTQMVERTHHHTAAVRQNEGD